MARQLKDKPKDIEYRAEYEPDMTRMVRALRVLLDYTPGQEEGNDGAVQGDITYVGAGGYHRSPKFGSSEKEGLQAVGR